MESLGMQSVFHIMQKTLNLVDYRLVDHGERVAYILLKMLECKIKKEGVLPYQDDLPHICLLAALHDIGAYKTETISSLADLSQFIQFEVGDVIQHSVFGYLFLKIFLPDTDYHDIVLYHHMRYDKLLQSDCRHKDLAAMIFLADRFDLLNVLQKNPQAENMLRTYQGSIFDPEAIKLLFDCVENDHLKEKLQSGEWLEELYEFEENTSFSEESRLNVLELLVSSIDFRSPHTVTHTITTRAISTVLAERLSVDFAGNPITITPKEKKAIRLGALLHDIGKIATPISILEKPGKLTPEEYDVMKDHVIITREILKNDIGDEIVEIAARHHEKLDGSGYPLGLSASDLTMPQRILAIADICSALIGRRSYKDSLAEDKVRAILQNDANAGKICRAVVDVLLNNYADIMKQVEEDCRLPLSRYRLLAEEYPAEMDKYISFLG